MHGLQRAETTLRSGKVHDNANINNSAPFKVLCGRPNDAEPREG